MKYVIAGLLAFIIGIFIGIATNNLVNTPEDK